MITENKNSPLGIRGSRYAALVEYFSENYPEAETELVYINPYELLVAVILSAPCDASS